MLITVSTIFPTMPTSGRRRSATKTTRGTGSFCSTTRACIRHTTSRKAAILSAALKIRGHINPDKVDFIVN